MLLGRPDHRPLTRVDAGFQASKPLVHLRAQPTPPWRELWTHEAQALADSERCCFRSPSMAWPRSWRMSLIAWPAAPADSTRAAALVSAFETTNLMPARRHRSHRSGASRDFRPARTLVPRRLA
eukprot:1005383-Pyramimonas_sp.AAC.1